jgi:hypothetical protein
VLALLLYYRILGCAFSIAVTPAPPPPAWCKHPRDTVRLEAGAPQVASRVTGTPLSRWTRG